MIDPARRLALVAVAAAALGATSTTHATTVVLVRPATPPPVVAETLVRLEGELTAAGFETRTVEGAGGVAAAGGAARASLEEVAGAHGADAVMAIVGSLAPDSVELWVVDKVTGKSVVRRVAFEPTAERAPETLAIRAIELLRSSFLEIDFGARQRPGEPETAPPPAVMRFLERERLARRPERLGLEVGGAGVMSLDGVGPALLPMVRLVWAARPWLVIDGTLAGLGTRPSVRSEAGSARVTQAWGLLGAAYRWGAAERLHPFVGLSAGALHTSVEGRAASSDHQGRSTGQWSFLVDATAGASLRLRERFQVTFAAHAQLAEPHVGVRFVDDVAATSGRPNVLATLALGAWL